MQASRVNSLNPPFVIINTQSSYNNIAQIEQQRQSQDLLARSYSSLYSQAQTNSSQNMSSQFDEIKRELSQINKRLDQLVERVQKHEEITNFNMELIKARLEVLETGQRNIVNRLQQVQEAAGLRRAQSRSQMNEDHGIQPVQKLQIILHTEQEFLGKVNQMNGSIQGLIYSGQTNLQMVSFYLFFRISKKYSFFTDKIFFRFIRSAFIGAGSQTERREIQLLKGTTIGKLCHKKVNMAKADFVNFKEGPNFTFLTFNFEQWLAILQQVLGMPLRLDNNRQAILEKMILFAISDPHILTLCTRVNKFIQFICFAKHYFFGQNDTWDMAIKIGLNKEEYKIAQAIVKELNKFMI